MQDPFFTRVILEICDILTWDARKDLSRVHVRVISFYRIALNLLL